MDSQMIERRLEALAKMQQVRAAALLAYQEARQSIIPPDVQAALADVDAEYTTMFQRMDVDIADVEQQVKAAVVTHGTTVSAAGIMAQFNKGRTTYDSKRLDGLALAYPAINECRKVGDPYVVLKSVEK